MSDEVSWNRADVEDVIRTLAETDAAFRARLIADPRGAIAELFRAEPKSGLTFTVVEEQPGEVVLVLPAAQDELSLAELDQASGGATYTIRFENRTTPGGWVFQKPGDTGFGSSIAWRTLPGGASSPVLPYSWWI
ncbi:MAG: hypothetical protein ACK4K8_16035 [Pannonibacter sp.]